MSLIAQRYFFALDYFQMQLLLNGLESDPFFHSTITKKAEDRERADLAFSHSKILCERV